MEYRLLGQTGLSISSLSVGTVSLGMEYGIKVEQGDNRPSRKDAVRLLEIAADEGINLFDTAPAYGESEELLGQALASKRDCFVATKVPIPQENGVMLTGKSLRNYVEKSLDMSLKRLKRDCADIVQIHNATPEVIEDGEMAETLSRLREVGKLRFVGASVYGTIAAQAVIRSGSFQVLQIAFNLFDQKMATKVLPLAGAANVGVICRSALLKGALTERAKYLPPELAPLRLQAEKAAGTLAGSWQRLPEVALRFCLSSPQISTVLIGVSNREELALALEAEQKGSLSEAEKRLAASLAIEDDFLTNPANWPLQ